MAKFRATVQLAELDGEDPAAARRGLEAGLANGGFAKWHVFSIEPQRPERKVEPPVQVAVARPHHRAPSPPPQINMGGLLLVAAAAWVVWLFVALTE